MDSIEYRGFWWLPNKPEKKVAGFLTFSQHKGGKLELIGVFTSMFEGASNDYPIILGITTDGKLITLQKCLVTNESVSSSSMTETTDLLVHFIFVGIHIPEESELKFNKIQARFTYLYYWVGVTGIAREHLEIENGQKFQVTYTMPEDISIPTPEGKIDVTFGANIQSGYDISNLNEKTSIFIECKEDKSFYEFSKNYLFPLQALISLGTTKPNFVEELHFFHKDFPQNPITVYYAQKFYQSKTKEHLLFPDMLFTLGNLSEDLETKINNWIVLSQKIDSVLHLLNRVRISPEMFLELKFLTIAQAIETYHRTNKKNEILPEEEYEAKVKEILDLQSEENRTWLEKILTHKNEPILGHRLNQLLIEHKSIINPLIDNPQDSNGRRGRFTNAVIGSRNFYTHFDKKGEAGALKGASLHWLTEKLSILLQACLIAELGIPAEKQVELFTQNEHYNRLRLE